MAEIATRRPTVQQYSPVSYEGARMKTTPIPVPRSLRRVDYRCITSLPAGKVIPLAAIPLLREDRLRMSRFRCNFEMLETAEILMNSVNVRVCAHLIPNLAFDRFDGIDALNRSYMKQPRSEAGTDQTVIPFFSQYTAPVGGAKDVPILQVMGRHLRASQTYNAAYIEAYNLLWNFRAKNRSPDINGRALNDGTFAKAFWLHNQFAHIVPDFDQALIDGEVPLNVTAGSLPVRGVGYTNAVQSPVGPSAAGSVRQRDAAGTHTRAMNRYYLSVPSAPTAGQTTVVYESGASGGFPEIYAELAENGITVSLANIELARKTQAFAALRKQYTGHDDDYIIDLLMNGITVPEQQWRQPILLADKTTIFGMAKRYASDSLDLTASVANGAAFVDLAITTPTVPIGGVVLITAEIMPEQLFERQQDPYLTTLDQDTLPEFLRDTLDPEKVEIVENQYVDMAHATPTGTFGYAPLNHKWDHQWIGIGGKFYRPTPDAPTDEDRMRFWAVETANPTLAEDFYLVSNMHTKPFVVTNEDPFEGVTRGLAQIEGNTVFGRMLIEASDDYAEIMAEAPMDRIDKPVALATDEQSENAREAGYDNQIAQPEQVDGVEGR